MLLWFLATLTGCGSGPTLVPVTGTVSLDGKPLAGADVTFHSSGTQQTAYAISSDDGSFTLRTISKQPGAEIGSYQVSVSKVVTPNFEGESMPADLDSQNVKPKWLTPKLYANPETSGFVIEVQKGISPVDLALNSQ